VEKESSEVLEMRALGVYQTTKLQVLPLLEIPKEFAGLGERTKKVPKVLEEMENIKKRLQALFDQSTNPGVAIAFSFDIKLLDRLVKKLKAKPECYGTFGEALKMCGCLSQAAMAYKMAVGDEVEA
jgi:hypothetical protein